jgi:hypothetical protein
VDLPADQPSWIICAFASAAGPVAVAEIHLESAEADDRLGWSDFCQMAEILVFGDEYSTLFRGSQN